MLQDQTFTKLEYMFVQYALYMGHVHIQHRQMSFPLQCLSLQKQQEQVVVV